MFRSFRTEYNDIPGTGETTLYCPMIDARRMEVYSSLFDSKGRQLKDVKAEIIDKESYKDLLDKGKIVFFGNGADKCADIIKHENAIFITDLPAYCIRDSPPCTSGLILK